ncbi:hypothetical protein J5Y04_40215 [Kitasatospora sp. RG8]|uniref:hypothetical protein n=1 Tax=Kitasatospora sp. RG8 TaxID=2820815 RepID=UPI001ADEC215|nr:hypothetical protein [Kitasatospora sp. RG8]MBP0455705.1 hypothetical protein [Kitasatospora sp. RG8]
MATGRLGTWMTGGGFGGSVIALVDTDTASTVTAAVETAFRWAGHSIPCTFTAVPASGARRIT